MRLPRWIPVIRRPWNPNLQETYESMTPHDRQVSWLLDASAVIFVLGVALWLG